MNNTPIDAINRERTLIATDLMAFTIVGSFMEQVLNRGLFLGTRLIGI